MSRGWSQALEDYATAWVQLSTDLSFFSLMWSSTPWTPSRGTSTSTRCLCTAPLRYQLQLSTCQLNPPHMCSPVPAAFNVIFRLSLLPSPFSKLKLYFPSCTVGSIAFISMFTNFSLKMKNGTFWIKICFSLCAPHSERSSLARPSSWGPALWSWPSWWLFSFQRSPPAPPLPPSCPSVRSPTRMAKSPCQRWPACTSTHLSQAAMKKVLPLQTMRTLSHSCRTVLFEWKLLLLLIYEIVEFKNQQHVFFAAQWA